MQDEIFGPILPIRGYRDLDDAIAYVEGRDRPLALYPFSHDRATVERILGRILAGGVTVNDTLLHFAAGNLPFGGVGASGMGASHGRAGFDAMTHAMPVLRQPRMAGSDLLKPPHRDFVDRMVRLLAGWSPRLRRGRGPVGSDSAACVGGVAPACGGGSDAIGRAAWRERGVKYV